MARTIEEIQQSIIDNVASDETLSTRLTSTSKTAIWRLVTYVIAACAWTIEKLFDIHKMDIDEQIAAKNPHTLRWYAEKARAFQFGFNLPADSDKYNNEGINDSDVEESKIIAYAAVVEQEKVLRVKLAKISGSDLGPLEMAEMNAFEDYMQKIKDAGVKLNITSGPADLLKLSLRIKYNPQVLNSDGERNDGQDDAPVKNAIYKHLLNLPFNGVFSIQKLVDAIQAVEGVEDLNVDQCSTKYGSLPFTAVNISAIPDAGYLRIEDTDLDIIYIPE